MRFIDKTRSDLAKIASADLQKSVSTSDVDSKLIDWIELELFEEKSNQIVLYSAKIIG